MSIFNMQRVSTAKEKSWKIQISSRIAGKKHTGIIMVYKVQFIPYRMRYSIYKYRVSKMDLRESKLIQWPSFSYQSPTPHTAGPAQSQIIREEVPFEVQTSKNVATLLVYFAANPFLDTLYYILWIFILQYDSMYIIKLYNDGQCIHA